MNRGVERFYVDIDWDKLKSLHPNANVNCMKKKWNPFKEWEQGFDSDCFSHCTNYDFCFPAMTDERTHLENHLKTIIIPCDKKLFWGDKEFAIKEIDES